MTSNQTAKSSIINTVCNCHLHEKKLQMQALQRARSTLCTLQDAFASDGSPLKRPSSYHAGSQTWLQQCPGPQTAGATLRVAPYLLLTAPELIDTAQRCRAAMSGSAVQPTARLGSQHGQASHPPALPS